MPDVDLSDLVGSPKLVTITSNGGRSFKVNAEYAERFRGLINDLEAGGYNVGTVQGYNDRNIAGTDVLSQHALGEAVDINPGQNARGTRGNIPPSLAQALAKKHGLSWGGDWRNPDPMHFEVPARGAPKPEGEAEAAPAPEKAAAGDVDLSDLADKPAPAAAPKKPTPLQRAQTGALDQFGHVGAEAQRQQEAATRGVIADVTTPEQRRPLAQQITDQAFPMGRAASDLFALAGGGAISGAFKAAVGDPVVNTLKAVTGGKDPVSVVTGGKYSLDPQQIGDYASMLIPGMEDAGLASRARAAGVSAETLAAAERTAQARRVSTAPRGRQAVTQGPNTLARVTTGVKTDPEHAPAVARLEAEGVKPAQHQRQGGAIQRVAESMKADPYVGGGIRASEKEALDSYNRAFYDKVLSPLGIKAPKTLPVGRDGVAFVRKTLSDAYDRVLPHVRVVGDKSLTDQLAAIRTSVAKLGAPQEQQFEAILNQDVLHHFQTGGMDGKTFKSVESDLLRQSRSLKGSPDPNARGLGNALEDVLDALRQDMVDHSPAKYRKELQGINESYAMFTRLEDAAARRLGSKGEITPVDLLAAVRKGDHTIRKGAFARGDALLQGFAEDGDRVLSPRHTTSHTPEIQNTVNMVRGRGLVGATMGGLGGMATGGAEGAMIGGAVGGVADLALARLTNHVTRRALTNTRQAQQPANYLKALQRRQTGRYGVPAALIASQANQP